MNNMEFMQLMLNEEFKKDLKGITKLFSDGCEAIAKKHKAEYGRVLALSIDIINTGFALTMAEAIRNEEHEE